MLVPRKIARKYIFIVDTTSRAATVENLKVRMTHNVNSILRLNKLLIFEEKAATFRSIVSDRPLRD